MKVIIMKFSEFDFHRDIAKGVKIAGFKEPSPIQEQAIPSSQADLIWWDKHIQVQGKQPLLVYL